MSKFITGEKLGDTIYDIIWGAQETLLIVSPYIKLDDYSKKLFNNHKKRPDIHIILVFGKNENDVHKSLSKNDLAFFKDFLNISIVYAPKLHAKYYGNETRGVVTSMNLYDYSFENNIEFGVYTEHNVLTKIGSAITGNNADSDAWNMCWEVANENNAIFIKRPLYENKKFIINFSKNYIKSEILHDSTSYFYERKGKSEFKKIDDFDDELELGSSNTSRPLRENTEEVKSTPQKKEYQQSGFCIRTGTTIPFNPKQPLSRDAWQIWSQYGDVDFREKYCHKTGAPSYGKTSMRNPILEK